MPKKTKNPKKKAIKSKNPKISALVRKAKPKGKAKPKVKVLDMGKRNPQAIAADSYIPSTPHPFMRLREDLEMFNFRSLYGKIPPNMNFRATAHPLPGDQTPNVIGQLPTEIAALISAILPPDAAEKVQTEVQEAIADARRRGINSGFIMVDLTPKGKAEEAPVAAPKPPRAPDNAYTQMVRKLAQQQDELGGLGGTFLNTIEDALAVEWETLHAPRKG